MRELVISRLRDPARPRRPQRSDLDLNPGVDWSQASRPPRQAAVLVPLIERGAELSVLLTKRAAHLQSHAGQISFPGGTREPEDPDLATTALREAYEEVGLPPDAVDLVGELDTYVTVTGFQIMPVVGLISRPFTPVPEPGEVDRIFEVPLSFFLERRNHQRHSRDFKGSRRHYYAMPFGEHYIWGATAGILVNLYDVLTQKGDAP